MWVLFSYLREKKYIPLKNTNTKTVWCLMRCLYFGCKMNFGSPAVQRGAFKRTVLLGAALACCTKRWTFHPLFPGLKVETLWRIGFQSAVAAARINCLHVMSNARVAPSTRLPKAVLIQLNVVRMTASFLTHEGLATRRRETLQSQERANLNRQAWIRVFLIQLHQWNQEL